MGCYIIEEGLDAEGFLGWGYGLGTEGDGVDIGVGIGRGFLGTWGDCIIVGFVCLGLLCMVGFCVSAFARLRFLRGAPSSWDAHGKPCAMAKADTGFLD